MVLLRLALYALGVLLLLPHAAAAGGWWSSIDVNRSEVAPGQRVEVDDTVTFSSIAAAEEAQEPGRFNVYLLQGFDYSVVERAMRTPVPGDWWSLGDAEAIQVGEVTVSVSDANLARATAEFTMPEISPGAYHLMLCDTACREPLADVIPVTDFTVVADRATAPMAQRVDRVWFVAAVLVGVALALAAKVCSDTSGREWDVVHRHRRAQSRRGSARRRRGPARLVD